MTTDILKREEVIKVLLGNFLSTTTSRKIHKSSCYLQKYYIYGIPLSQGDSIYHPIIAVFSRILQMSQKKKYFSMISGYCKFLTNILAFTFSIIFFFFFSFIIFGWTYDFSQALKTTWLSPGASKYYHLKIHHLIF